jgi:hypothetical protein
VGPVVLKAMLSLALLVQLASELDVAEAKAAPSARASPWETEGAMEALESSLDELLNAWQGQWMLTAWFGGRQQRGGGIGGPAPAVSVESPVDDLLTVESPVDDLLTVESQLT